MNLRLAVFLLAVLLSPTFLLAKKLRGQMPNVILIVADDLGYSDTSIFATPSLAETPNLTRLKSLGMTFTNAYTPSPICSPTRASILTSLYPTVHGITQARGHVRDEIMDPYDTGTGSSSQECTRIESASRLKNGYNVLPEELKSYGYVTGHLGKWHLGRSPYVPLNQGFDSDIPQAFNAGPPGGYLGWSTPTCTPDTPDEHIEDRMGKEAIHFLNRNKLNRFFLNYWQWSIHGPFEAKPALVDKYVAKKEIVGGDDSPTVAAMIQSMDGNIGRILNWLDDNPAVKANTILIFTADNGGNTYSQVDGTTPSNNFPFRGGKGTLREGGIRVPLIVVWPGVVAPGSVSNQSVSSVDLYPTIMHMVQKPFPAQAKHGISIKPALLGNNLPVRAIFSFFPHYSNAPDSVGPAIVCRYGKWKLYRLFHKEGPDQHGYLLYDLDVDPGEANDLSATYPETVGTIDAMIQAHLDQSQAVVPSPNPLFFGL